MATKKKRGGMGSDRLRKRWSKRVKATLNPNLGKCQERDGDTRPAARRGVVVSNYAKSVCSVGTISTISTKRGGIMPRA